MSCWVRPVTRWAFYFRDDLSCTYCGITAQELVNDEAGENFLTLDHIKPRHKGGSHEAGNVVTCCYECNIAKGRGTMKDLCATLSLPYARVRQRSYRVRSRDLEPFRAMARLALGQIDGFPVSTLAREHDYLVKKQWGSDFDAELWAHVVKSRQTEMWCPTCGRLHERDEAPVRPSYDDEDLPF